MTRATHRGFGRAVSRLMQPAMSQFRWFFLGHANVLVVCTVANADLLPATASSGPTAYEGAFLFAVNFLATAAHTRAVCPVHG